MTIASSTQYKWRLDIIRGHVKIGEAKAISVSCKFDESADVTRTMSAEVPTDGFIVNSPSSLISVTYDMFTDRLRPVVVIDDTEFDLGDYIVIGAPKESNGKTNTYSIEAYDETMILKEAAAEARLYFAAGSRYLDIINTLLTNCSLTRTISDLTDATITADREFAIGTTYLSIINTLLAEINYSNIHAGSSGNLYITKYRSKVASDYAYTSKNATLIGSVKCDTDIYSLPNVIIGYVSNPDIDTTLICKKVNDSPVSEISTVKRGYKVVSAKEYNDCPDQATLQGIVDQRYMDATQATETAEITTLPDGPHEYGSYCALDINGTSALYREVGWSVVFDGQMSHSLERKVFA